MGATRWSFPEILWYCTRGAMQSVQELEIDRLSEGPYYGRDEVELSRDTLVLHTRCDAERARAGKWKPTD